MSIEKQLGHSTNLVGGEWIDGEERTDVIYPYDGRTIGSVPLMERDTVRSAIEAAESACEDSELSAYERYELLYETARLLQNNAAEMARIITLEEGKPLTESRTEVDRAVQTLRLCGEEAKRLFGEYIPMDGQQGFARTHAFTQREPVGVVAAITPFNFPLNLMVHKVGPALAAGNAVVGKPATNTPFSSLKLFEYLDRAMESVDAPAGLANVITGSGKTVGDMFCQHDAIEAISFTGSTAVGKYLAANSGMTELTLELGGNDPTIVWDDADIEQTATQLISGACSNAGQVCNSVERVIAHEAIEDELIEALVAEANSLSIGDPFDEGTDIAALISDEESENVGRILEETRDAGATVECGGNYDGRQFEPTVLSGVTPEMPAAKEEVFGPLVPVLSVRDFDEAIEEANNTEYGLEAGLFTQDIDRAKRAADEIDAGAVNINTVSGFRTDHMPYGGFKDSGVGKEGVKYAVKHFSREKLVGLHAGTSF